MDKMQSIDCNLVNICQLGLEINPMIVSQQYNLDRATYAVDVVTSEFDPVLFSAADFSRSGVNLNELDQRSQLIGNMLNTDVYQLSGGLSKKLNTGVTVRTSMEFQRTSDNIPVSAYNEYVGSHTGVNTTSINASFSQPLLRLSGKGYNNALIDLAQADVVIEKSFLEFNTSEQLQNMALAYWQYFADYQRIDVYQANVQRVNRVLEITTELVHANKKPASDLIQIQADLLDKERQVISAKQSLYASKQNLARFIGVSEKDVSLIGAPSDQFPSVDEIEIRDLQGVLQLSLVHRSDVHALYHQRDKSEILVKRAENESKPSLDLVGSLSYGGSDLGNGIHRIVSPLVKDDGRNYRIGMGVRYNIPIGNHRAEANLLISKNNELNQDLIYDNQIRNIEINVSIEYSNLLNSIEAVNKSKRTLEYYDEVFENEQLKFKNGLSTILNLIIFQERLTFAQLEYLFNQQQLAMTITRLRHQTGTLLQKNEGEITINDKSVFYQLPLAK